MTGRESGNILLEFSSDNVRENFEFAMGVGPEAGAGCNAVFVNHAKRSKELVFVLLVTIKCCEP